MSEFLYLSNNTLDEYLCILDSIIIAKLMEEAGLPIDLDWEFADYHIPHRFLYSLFGEALEYDDAQTYRIKGALTRSGQKAIKEFAKGRFDSEYVLETITIKVKDDVITIELGYSEYRLHSIFEDFVKLEELWKSLRERKDHYENKRRQRQADKDHSA